MIVAGSALTSQTNSGRGGRLLTSGERLMAIGERIFSGLSDKFKQGMLIKTVNRAFYGLAALNIPGGHRE